MADTEQRQSKLRRSQTTVRELRATITVNDDDLRGLVGQIQQPVLDAVSVKLLAIEKAVASLSAAPLAPALQQQPVIEKPVGGLNLSAAERLKAADLRIALLLGKVPDTAGLMIGGKTTAKLLNVSVATLYRLQAEEAIPQPVRIGKGTVRWRLAEIIAWIDQGCPPRRDWTYPEDSERTKRRR